MSHLETPFHPGPFAAHQQQQAQAHAQGQQAYPPPNQNHLDTSAQPAPHPQAFASANSPHPGSTHARPPPPHFHDGLMQQHQQQHHHQHQQHQQQNLPPHFSPAAAFPGQQSPYTSAPFGQPVPATSATPTPPLQHHQQHAVRHSASPQQITSPYAGPSPSQFQQPQQPPKQHTPPTKYPMAAPPLPQTPAAVQQSGGTNSGSPKATQSPGTLAREQKRTELLLDINGELLQEINNLQAQGRGGAVNPQHQQQLRALNMSESMASEEYIQCLRRVQANLAYLMPRADAGQASKAPPGPAHMTAPAHMPQLQAKYEQLKELFPGWPGLENRMPQNVSSPRTNQMNSMNGMNPQNSAPMAPA